MWKKIKESTLFWAALLFAGVVSAVAAAVTLLGPGGLLLLVFLGALFYICWLVVSIIRL